jgi:hypothetical protein
MPLNARSGTLTPSTATPIAITDAFPGGIWVHNRTQTGEIWVRLDGTPAAVAADDNFLVSGSRHFPPYRIGTEAVTVSLISNQALDYTVEGTVVWTP